MTQCSIV